MKYALFLLLLISSCAITAAEQSFALQQANIDPHDNASLKRGAKYFADYCFNCHATAMMRYSRIAGDLGMSEDEIARTMIYTGAKIGDTMSIALQKEDAKRWFGTVPPDLSVIARSRGVNWLYTYLRSFYQDESRPWGVNNAVFKDVAMPHVLWELQGLQQAKFETVTDKEGVKHSVISELKLVQPGKLSPEEFDETVRDIVNFLHYVGEPAKQKRLAMGKWVLLYLAVFLVLSYLLKKEYWKDVKRRPDQS